MNSTGLRKKSSWEDLQPHSGVKKYTHKQKFRIAIKFIFHIWIFHICKFMNPFFSCLPSILKKSGGEFGLILALWNYRNISNNFSFVLRNCSEKRSCPFSPLPELFANSKIFPNWVERAPRLPLQNGVSKCRHPLTIPYFRPPLSSVCLRKMRTRWLEFIWKIPSEDFCQGLMKKKLTHAVKKPWIWV